MTHPITASMLYNLMQCPNRVALDLFEDPAKQDEVSKFVELLWERGAAFEDEVIGSLEIPFTDLREMTAAEREHATTEALASGAELICGGRIRHGRLLGEPDLLRLSENGYVAGDIKSGAALEGSSDLADGRPKKHYAVQLALYTDILEGLGHSAGRFPFVWDISKSETAYELDALQGKRNPKSLWDSYIETLAEALNIADGREKPAPAHSPTCKLCHWWTVCHQRLEQSDDLTLVPDLGRTKRDNMVSAISTVQQLAAADVEEYVRGKKTVFPGVGPSSLYKFQQRARARVERLDPYLTEVTDLPHTDVELFFDVETDPFRDVCYLHGFVERRGGDSNNETFHAFFANAPEPENEEESFQDAYAYLTARMPCAVYFYTKYERTEWKKLAKKYPSVASEDDIEAVFEEPLIIDLYYDVVVPKTVWPTRDHSIKTLAVRCGFEWRDESPSGAESIEWYHRWVDTGDQSIKQRILEYNEDDCRAMRVLVDAVQAMAVRSK
jgi:uncharacterized protein